MLWLSKKWRENRRLKNWQSSRMIYEYFDGTKFVRADPLVISRLLETDPEMSLDKHPQLANSGDLEATRVMLSAIRRAFNVEPLDGLRETGLTEIETFDLLSNFYEWQDEVKKNFPDLPIQSAHLEPTSGGSGETITQRTADSFTI